MAQSRDKDQPTLPAPALVSPREAEVLDGRSITFAWERVDGATKYQLEVSTRQEFDELAYEKVLQGEVSATVSDTFATDGTLYFWRVLAGDDAGWSNGDHVESFVSVSADEATGERASRPDERLGPYPALIRSATVEAAAEVTGEEDLLHEEEAAGVEHEGVEAGQILGITLAIAAAIVMIVIVLFQWTRIVERETRAAAAGLSGYPELREARMQARQQLESYGVADPDAGLYRIPIDRAMELMAQEARASGDAADVHVFPVR